jgi:tetratricopeptide (TPR) repeat protein
LEVFQQEDVDPALNRGEPPAAAFGLRGHAQLAASREKTGAAAVELINKATDDYDKAIQESSGGPYYTELLDGGAAAYVERANLDRDSSIEQLREYLTRAVKYAKESTDVGYRPYPESAWLNLGNAEEDFTAVIGEKSDHYCEAIEAFGKAGKAAFDAGRSPASAHYSQGRCRCKLVEDLIDGFLGPEQACGKSIDVHLQTALDELQKALQVGTDDPRRALEGDKRAEANYWRAKLYVRQADRAADGQKSLDLANDAILAASEGVKETSADWPIYQDWSAKIALKMGQPERARQCAEKLLGVPTAPLNKKALAVRHLVDSYTRQKNPKAGLEALKKYLNATEFRTAGRSRVDLLTLCSRHITEFADDLWNATNQKLGEDTAREAIKLALEIPDPVGASKAYVALADHVSVTAYRSTSGDFTLAQLHLYADCLAKAIDQQSIGQQSVLPASLRSRKELARAHRRLARWPNLPLDKRIGYATAGIKTLIGAEKATRDPREVSEIVALRKDLEMLSKASK